jgi:hypothetical protein
MIRVSCPGCGHVLEFADAFARLTVSCKHCAFAIDLSSAPRLAGPSEEPVASKPTILPPKIENESPPRPKLRTRLHDPAPQSEFDDTERSVAKAAPFDPKSVPDWALDRARVLRGIGQPIPGIVKQLVSAGLDSTTAQLLAEFVIEEGLRQTNTAAARSESRLYLHRVLSTIVLVVCLVLAYLWGEERSVIWTLTWATVPIMVIWFGDKAREMLGYEDPSSDFLLRIAGWVALLVILGRRIAFLVLAD